MKIVYCSLRHKAGNELNDLNLESLKTDKRLDKAMTQLCVTLTKRDHARNVGVPNDVAVVKWVNS